MPRGLVCALAPVLEQIAQMTLKIKQYDRLIIELPQTQYPETQALLEVQGVGHITALTFVLTLGNKQRFRRSRDVGCYLVCDHDAVSQEIEILSSASRRRAAFGNSIKCAWNDDDRTTRSSRRLGH